MKFFILMLSVFVDQSLTQKMCNNFQTCGACIGFAEDTCVWCSEPNVAERCQSKSFYLKDKKWCKEKFVYNPKQEIPRITEDTPLRPAEGKLPAVQFRPQQMAAKLRPGNNVQFTMAFKHADDYPLDVYYLMDYSYTMKKHVNELKTQSRFVKEQLTKFTNNVRFGLGSFVEKPDYPFVGIQHRAYAFRNHLSMTTNITQFDQVLSEERDFSNYDLPEAGLDALMQAMACEKELGWRRNVRRIIVLCTDATYHSAGDGKFVLAYKPNDMKCHLNASMYYDHSLIQDYPSVSQINKMAVDGNFRIIFATLQTVAKTYSVLAKQIDGADSALLVNREEDHSNIFNIIKAAYLASIRHVTIKYEGVWPPFVQLKLNPDCTRMESEECKMGHKQSIKMNATLKVTGCPSNSYYNQTLLVGPVDGGPNDKLKIHIEVDCRCDCEKDKSGIPNSPMCTKFGTYQCGICACNKDRYGDVCQCDGDVTSKTDLEKCKNTNDTNFCSGQGTCVCGKCSCNRGFSGDFCEFDDNSCKRRDNKLCSGNGRCTHGACECDSAQWTGDDCGCSIYNNNCFAPYSKEICSGKGDCICNECVCRKRDGKQERYSGVFCDDCEDCDAKRCKELEKYARCNFVSNKTYCDEQYDQTFNTEVLMLNKSEINNSKWSNAKWCRTNLDDYRMIVFGHMYDKKLILIIQMEAEEIPKADIWVSVGIAIATVVFIGLLTVLVWKLVVDAMDEKEYNKFMQQAKSEGYDVSANPIYQPASVNFSNPTYNVLDNTLIESHH